MKQACFFLGVLSTVIVEREFGMPGVVLLGASDLLLYIAEKVWGE